LVWCGLKQAENKPKTTHVSEQCLSLAENAHIRKRSYSAGFQAENVLFKNPSKGIWEIFQLLSGPREDLMGMVTATPSPCCLSRTQMCGVKFYVQITW